MSVGKRLRQRRIMGRGRVVIVAMDHGNAAGIVRGLEDPVRVMKVVAQSGADGVLVTPGILEQTLEEVGELAVLLRIDGCVSTLGRGPMRLFTTVEEAVSLGVDGVVLNATLGAHHEGEELEKVGRAASEGRRWGVPVIAEILSDRMMANHMDMTGSGAAILPSDIAADIGLACRLGVELGADAIKTRYSGDVDSFRQIVAATGRPVLVAGGPMRDGSLEATLELVDDALQAGAGGVIFGRNIWQQNDPAEALRALCAMVHEDATVEEALEASTA